MRRNLLNLQRIGLAAIMLAFAVPALNAQEVSTRKIDHTQRFEHHRQHINQQNFGSSSFGIETNETEYCTPFLDCTDNDAITLVSLNEINNPTTCSPNGYGDYTSMSATVTAGESYSISVGVGDGWSNESVSVWIDYNNNFVFDDSEFTFIGTGSDEILTGTIAIPASTEAGTYRMRVRVAAIGESTATGDKACDEEVDFYGETEDYTIIVEAGDGNGDEDEDEEIEGCTDGDIYPSATFTPSCLGIAETITTVTWAAEYSNVAVTEDVEYTFASSNTSDFITITDGTANTIYAAGTTPLVWTATAGEVIRYYIHADENCGSEMASRVRTVLCGEPQPAPENDECDNAIALSCGDSVSGNTMTATNSGGNAAPDVFYSYTGQGEEEYITVSLCGSSYDTALRVFTDCTLSEEFAYNDDFCGVQSEVSFLSDGITTYYIMVEGYSSNAGAYTLDLTCEAPPTPPENCEDFVVESNDQENGLFFGGDTMQRIATDIPVGDTPLTIYGMEPSLIETASYFDFLIYQDDAGLPGAQIETRTGIIISNEMTGSNFGYNFYKYSVEFDTPLELDANTTYWIEIQTDALAWEATELIPRLLGSSDVFQNANNGFVWTSASTQFVFNFICSTMGVNDLVTSKFAYYPNPVNDVLHISSEYDVQKVEVYNMAGQKVSAKFQSGSSEVNVASLPTGTYVLRVLLDNGKTETIKIIKK